MSDRQPEYVSHVLFSTRKLSSDMTFVSFDRCLRLKSIAILRASITCSDRSLTCFSCRLINILAVRAYGEAEFWLSGGKVILIFSLFFYTFITMVGGNPENDAYGFRYFGGGRAFQPLYPGETKSLAQFEGFLAALWQSAFTVVGKYPTLDI